MGGMVGQLVAYQQRERVSGLVLCSTASYFRRGVRQRVALDLFGRTLQSCATGPRSASSPATRAANGSRAWKTTGGGSPSSGPRAWAIAVALDEIGRFDSAPWLHTLRVPTSVVVTSRDGFIAPAHQRSLARRIPGAATYEIPAGHTACVLAATSSCPR